MELHKVPNRTYVRVLPQVDVNLETTKTSIEEVKVPIAAPEVIKGELIYFDHIDGMYSLCYKVDEKTGKHGESCHIAAWTDVEVVDMEEGKDFTEIRETIGRSGYGKDGQGEYRQSALSDMSDEWVKASIDFVPKDHVHRKYYIQELEYRKINNISIKD